MNINFNERTKPIFSTGVRTNNLITNSGSINNLETIKSNIDTLNVDILTINDKIDGDVEIDGNIKISCNTHILYNYYLYKILQDKK